MHLLASRLDQDQVARAALSAAAMRTNGSRSSGSKPSAASTTVWRFSRRFGTAAMQQLAGALVELLLADPAGEQRLDLAQGEQRRALLDQALQEGVELRG